MLTSQGNPQFEVSDIKMPDDFVVVNQTISKEIVKLEYSELKIEDTLTLVNIVFTQENKQVLLTMNHKVLQPWWKGQTLVNVLQIQERYMK